MQLSTGVRLRSQVCDTQVVVIRASPEATVTCGGLPMVELSAPEDARQPADPDWMSGNELGKRYTAGDPQTLEVLVTKAGEGTLGDGADPLVKSAPKLLPSTD